MLLAAIRLVTAAVYAGSEGYWGRLVGGEAGDAERSQGIGPWSRSAARRRAFRQSQPRRRDFTGGAHAAGGLSAAPRHPARTARGAGGLHQGERRASADRDP